MDSAQKNYVDNLMRSTAEKAYDREMAEWQDNLEQEEKRNAEKLQDPRFAISLGLPPNLPRHTINILKKTIALDKIGPQKPEIDKVYRRYGL